MPRRSPGGAEIAAFAAVLIAAATLRVVLQGGPQLNNDSYQYLSVADNLRHGHSLSTSIVHFDTERARGRVPAPATTFPPGYAIAIAALSCTGLPPEWAGLFLSLASAVLVLPLLRAASAALGLTTAATRACFAVWALSAQASLYAAAILTESAFTAMSLASVVLVARAERSEGRCGWCVLLGFFLAASAYWVRYAGIFLVAALHVYVFRRALRDRGVQPAWLLALAVCDALVLALIARNIWIAGTWMGGNTRDVFHGVSYVAHRLAVGTYELTLGSLTSTLTLPFGLFAASTLVGGLVMAGTVAHALATGRRERGPRGAASTLLLVWAGVYCSGMAYVGLTSDVSVGSRMFVPMLPVAALLAAELAVTAARRKPALFAQRAVAVFAAVLLLGYVGANTYSTVRSPRVAKHRLVARALELPTSDGDPLATWIESTVPKDSVLLSVEGQATGYVLKRRTISAVEPRFSDLTWDEATTRRIMSQFNAEYLVLYRDAVSASGDNALDSDFFRRIVSGDLPDWLELAGRNAAATILRRRGNPRLDVAPSSGASSRDSSI